MQDCVFTVGSRVRVTSYGPLWGLHGTIRAVYPIEAVVKEHRCFYLVKLDGMELSELVWLAQGEVAAVTPHSGPLGTGN